MSSTLALAIGAVVVIAIASRGLLLGSPDWGGFARGPESLGYFASVLSIFASLAGGFMVFGVVQMGFEGGLSGYIIGATYIFGMGFLYWGMPKVAERVDVKQGLFGIDQLIKNHYGSKSQIGLYILVSLLFAGVLGGQLLSISFVLDTFNTTFNKVILVGVGLILTCGLTIWYGLSGVIINDIIQGLLVLIIAFILPVYLYLELGGIDHIRFSPLNNGIGGEYGIVYPLAGFIFLLPTFLVRVDLWQRIRLHNADNNLLLTCISTGLILSFFYASMTTSGIIVKSNLSELGINPTEKASRLAINLAAEVIYFEPFLVLVVAGMIIALLSSVESYLQIVTSSTTKLALWDEIPDSFEFSDEENNVVMFNARIIAILVFIVAGIFAFLIPDIVDLLSSAFSVFGILLPVVLWAIFSSRDSTSDWVACSSFIISLVICLSSLPFLQELAFIPAVVAGTLFFGVFLLFD